MPGITYRVTVGSLSELLDFRIGQFCEEVQVSLLARTVNTNFFVGRMSDYLALKKGLASLHRGNLTTIEVPTHAA
ncbi:hypothetical protein HMPREF2550_05165 [Corynebacterium sp. HMSC074A01]|nr:hypothetical protein HMPREF2550_05165 [Corynebacterium sp. HMSC074A01]